MKRDWASALLIVLIQFHSILAAESRGIADLLKALEAEETQFEAIRDLGDLGLDAAPAVPQLIRLLDAPERETRAAAANALGAIGTDATAAIPKLIERLGEPEVVWPAFEMPVPDASLSAAMALGKMGKEAVWQLERCLADDRPHVRSLAAYALGAIGPAAKAAVPSLIRRSKDTDDSVRREAVSSLGRIGADASNAIPAIVDSLADKNDDVRATAAEALGSIRPTTPAAVAGLIRALRDKECDVQHAAAESLGRLGADAAPAIPALVKMLESREAYRYSHPVVLRPVAGTAARALGALGPRAREAMPALLEVVRNRKGTFDTFGIAEDNYEARAEAAIAAARIDPQSDELLRVLGRSLEEDKLVRRKAAVALAQIGPKAQIAVSSLVRLAESDSWWSSTCACAVVAIEPKHSQAVDKLIERLPPRNVVWDDDEWAMLRTALAKAGARARPAIPILIESVRDSSQDRKNAARTLASLGPQAEDAIPALLDLLARSWDAHLWPEAIAAIQDIASEKSPVLQAALKNPNPNIRSGVAKVLAQFPGAAPLLTVALDDPSARVRLAALSSLDSLDGSAKPAIPRIRKLLQDDSRTIREAAAKTLRKLEDR
jgi:HEAT repeat protein